MWAFISRILKVYFRDKTAVFFSLLSSFIIIGLYILFLGDTYTSEFNHITGVRQLMDLWLMAGLLATSSVSTTIAVFGIMINDRVKKIYKDFYCTPIQKYKLSIGYLLAAIIVGFILSLITLLFAQIYILVDGGNMFDFIMYMKIICALIVNVIMNGSMMFFIASFFYSHTAFSTATSLIGTLIGFLTGIYLPIGSLPDIIQWIIRIFPTTHSAALLKQIMMEPYIHQVFVHVPKEFIVDFKEYFGITLSFHNIELTPLLHYIYLSFFIVLFFVIAMYYRNKVKNQCKSHWF